MKNLFKNLMLVAVAAMGFTACEQVGIESVTPVLPEVEMTVNVDMDDTRTYIDETNKVVKWSDGDQLMVIENENTFRKTTDIAIDADGRAAFTVSFPAKAGEVTYNAIFPASVVNTGAEFTAEELELQVKSTQWATADSFDPAADLLVAKQLELDAQPDELNMQFKRIVALGKITLNGMDGNSNIKQVSFTAGDEDVLAGRNLVDATSATVLKYGNENATNVITVNYKEAISTRNIYFVCNPFEMAAGETFTVEVICDNAIYTREVVIPAGRTVTFTEGNLGTLSVDMSNGDKVEVATSVTDTLERDITGVTSTTYTSWSGKTVTSGAVYAGNSAGGNSSIQLRGKDSSGIVTTTSGGLVRKIIVTWNTNTQTGRTLDIYGKNVAYTSPSDLYDTNKGEKLGSIVKGTSTELVIEGDYAYIGMRSYEYAMYITKIEIEWQPDGGNGGGAEIVVPSFDLDKRELSYAVEGGSQNITVEPIDGFDNIVSAETDAEWLTIANDDYTFTVTAEENEGFARNATITFSADGCEDIVVAVSQNPNPNAAIEATVEEFLAAKEDATLYRLRGTITGMYQNNDNDYKYGNFYLTDDTGTVLIYGLYSPENTPQYWAESGAQLGDDIEVITVRTSYGSTPQGKNAIFVEKQRPGTIAFWSFDKTSVSFESTGGKAEIKVDAYNLKEDVELAFKAGEDGDFFEADYANGVLTISAGTNSSTEALNATLYVRSSGLEQIITISQAAYVDPDEVVTATESVDFSKQSYANGVAIDKYEGGNFSIAFNKGSNSNAPKYYASGEAIRCYGGNYFTITSDKTIVTIELTYGSSDGTNTISTDVGTFVSPKWTGESESVKFTIGGSKGNRRIQGIKVTYVK